MGDERHKKPPPPEEEEEVTDAFRLAARKALESNKRQNALRGLRKPDPGYLISNRAELAIAVGTDKTMINKIIGPAKLTTKIKLVGHSTYVGRIRSALELPSVTQITVRSGRVNVLRWIADLSDEDFAEFEDHFLRKRR